MAEKRISSGESGSNELEVIEFLLHYSDVNNNLIVQSYGINVIKVREIITMPKLTKLPNLPDCVYGVFNVRGTIIPALDLQKALYGEANSNSKKKMIIAEFNKMRVGFIVDDVSRIHRISWNDILSPESLTSYEDNTQSSSVIGFVNMDDRHILMIDVEKIVADINPASAIGESDKDYIFGKKFKVITVDDSETIRKLIHAKLQKVGFDITSFNDGEAAWNGISEINKQLVESNLDLSNFVDLIITDIEMPKMDGYSLIKNIRSLPAFATIPIIIFSSIITQDMFYKGQNVGATVQLSKPQVGDLIETIYNVTNEM